MNAHLSEGFYSRTLTLEDAQAVTDLLNACSFFITGEKSFDFNEIVSDFSMPSLDLATHCHAVFSDEQVVGYAELWDFFEPYVRYGCMVRVHPDFRGHGIEDYLWAWINSNSRRALPKAPSDARVYLISNAHSLESNIIAELIAQGFEHVRSTYRMQIEFDNVLPVVTPPEGFTFRPFNPGEDSALVHACVQDAFRDHFGFLPMPFEQWRHWFIDIPDLVPELWTLAYAGDDLAGVAMCATHNSELPQHGYIHYLAVRRPFRRRGLGKALLLHSFKLFQDYGKIGASLGVDTHNLTGALKLYEDVGMRATSTYLRYEKELRAGKDLAVRSLQMEAAD